MMELDPRGADGWKQVTEETQSLPPQAMMAIAARCALRLMPFYRASDVLVGEAPLCYQLIEAQCLYAAIRALGNKRIAGDELLVKDQSPDKASVDSRLSHYAASIAQAAALTGMDELRSLQSLTEVLGLYRAICEEELSPRLADEMWRGLVFDLAHASLEPAAVDGILVQFLFVESLKNNAALRSAGFEPVLTEWLPTLSSLQLHAARNRYERLLYGMGVDWVEVAGVVGAVINFKLSQGRRQDAKVSVDSPEMSATAQPVNVDATQGVLNNRRDVVIHATPAGDGTGAGVVSVSGSTAVAPTRPPSPTPDPVRPTLQMLQDEALTDDNGDRLDFKVYADAIAGLIDHEGTKTPLTVAINAPWGMGKTTLARMVKRRLETQTVAGKPADVVCWFNAWMHDDANNIVTALMAEVARTANQARDPLLRLMRPLPWNVLTSKERSQRRWLGRLLFCVLLGFAVCFAHHLGFLERLNEILRSLVSRENKQSPLIPTASITGAAAISGTALAALLKVLETITKPLLSVGHAIASFVRDPEGAAAGGSLKEVRDQLGDLIRQATVGGSRFVVFIDDLERCRPPRSIDMLEGVNQLLCLPNVVTVFMAHLPTVYACVSLKYEGLAREGPDAASARNSFGRDFLQKIVQVQFDLPAHRSERVRHAVEALAREDERPGVATSEVINQPPFALGRLGQALRYRARRAAVKVVRDIPVSRADVVVTIVLLLLAYGILSWLFPMTSTLPLSPASNAARTGVRAALLIFIFVFFIIFETQLIKGNLRRIREARALREQVNKMSPEDLRDPERAAAGLLKDVRYLERDEVVNLVREEGNARRFDDVNTLIEAYDEVYRYLPESLRNAKRVVNHLRVLLFVADGRRLFSDGSPVTPRHIGKWVALRERWPEVAEALTWKPQRMSELEAAAAAEGSAFEHALHGLLPGYRVSPDLQSLCNSEPKLADVMESLVYFEA